MILGKKEFKHIYDREVVKLMRDSKVPGFVVKIMKDNEIYYERSYGSRNLKGTKPVNSDTLFGIASMTKSITSLSILLLQEQGKLSIEDKISDYLPVDLDKYPDSPIKIKHLMAHASGIPNLGSYGVQIKNEELTQFNVANIPMANWDDFYFHINDAKDWILSPPGTKYYYNNDAYTLLSQIVPKVSEKSYEDFVKENILTPLQMERSTYNRQELREIENVAKGYSSEFHDKQLKRNPKPHLSGPFQSGAGGLNSSANDLINYLNLHLNNGQYEGNRIISEDLIHEMRKPHNTNMAGENLYLPSGSNMSYGYGFRIEEFFGYTLITHGGASGVSGGVVAFIPELNISYVHLYNVGWFSSHMMYIALAAMIGKSPYKEIPYLQRREHFKKLSGDYANYRKNMHIKIVSKDGLLFYENEIIQKSSLPLVPIDPEQTIPTEFYIYSGLGRSIVRFIEKEEVLYFEIERNIYRKLSYHDDIEPFQF